MYFAGRVDIKQALDGIKGFMQRHDDSVNALKALNSTVRRIPGAIMHVNVIACLLRAAYFLAAAVKVFKK